MKLGPDLWFEPDTQRRLDVVADPRLDLFELRLDGRVGLVGDFSGGTDGEYAVNRYGMPFLRDTFAGSIVPSPIDMSLCRTLLDSVAPD